LRPQAADARRAGEIVSVADLAIVAALVFGWGALSARLERFDVTAPIAFVVAGLLLTDGPLAVLSVTPSRELIKELAEFTSPWSCSRTRPGSGCTSCGSMRACTCGCSGPRCR
jgi:hypothetical protein